MAEGSISNPIVIDDKPTSSKNGANDQQLGTADKPILVKEGKWDYLDNLEADKIREELLKDKMQQWFLDNY